MSDGKPTPRWRLPTMPEMAATIETAAPDGRYGLTNIVSELGDAALWRGHDRETGERLGLLVVDTEGSITDAIGWMGAVEASSGRLRPGEVAVRGFADDGEQLLVVLDALPGHSLRTVVVRETPLAPQAAVGLAAAIVVAMADAHRNGECWGGIEPEFVLVRSDGAGAGVQLVPAALCRAAVGPLRADALGLRAVGYRAPEILLGDAYGPAADVFAAGVILYELLTGESPFAGHTSARVAAAVISSPVAKLVGDARVKPESDASELASIDAVLDRLLRKSPAERPADAVDALQWLLDTGLA